MLGRDIRNGDEFGNWTVLKFLDNHHCRGCKFLCRCKCGREREVLGKRLIRGISTNCGCEAVKKRKNQKLQRQTTQINIGDQFGRLIVLRQGAIKYKNRIAWVCRCDCGKEIETAGSSLRRGYTNSCGCLRKEFHKNRRQSIESVASRAILTGWQKGASARGYSFNLTPDQCRIFMSSPCVYCGRVRVNCHTSGFQYNGIDRVNNQIGYEESNCVACCKFCNHAKKDHKQSEFLEWVSTVYHHHQASNTDYFI